MAKLLKSRNKTNSYYGKNYYKNYESGFGYKSSNITYLYENRIKQLLAKCKKKSKILDVGCAYGNLLSFLDKEGFLTFGIDISAFALKRAKKNTSACLVRKDIDNGLPYNNNYFEAIIAQDLIEHLESPYRFLCEAKRILKKNGLLMIQTPNINSLFEWIFKKNWFGYKDKTHLHLFNRKSLGFLLKQVGFEVIINETILYSSPKFIRTFFNKSDIGGSLWLVARKE